MLSRKQNWQFFLFLEQKNDQENKNGAKVFVNLTDDNEAYDEPEIGAQSLLDEEEEGRREAAAPSAIDEEWENFLEKFFYRKHF